MAIGRVNSIGGVSGGGYGHNKWLLWWSGGLTAGVGHGGGDGGDPFR